MKSVHFWCCHCLNLKTETSAHIWQTTFVRSFSNILSFTACKWWQIVPIPFMNSHVFQSCKVHIRKHMHPTMWQWFMSEHSHESISGDLGIGDISWTQKCLQPQLHVCCVYPKITLFFIFTVCQSFRWNGKWGPTFRLHLTLLKWIWAFSALLAD